MVSTFLILAVVSFALAQAWSLLRCGHCEIRDLEDWQQKRHALNVQIFRVLLDPEEERYLRRSLPEKQFQIFQRRRIRLTLGMLRLAEENAGMLIRVGQLARLKRDATLTRKAAFTQRPDTLAKSPRSAKFRWVSQRTVIGDGANRIEIYPIRNASGERMLMLYFPEYRLLYSSDLVQPLGDGSFFWPEYLQELSDAVRREHLSVDRFFGMHAVVTPWSAVAQYLAKVTNSSGVQDKC
jgi:hypothetical protein